MSSFRCMAFVRNVTLLSATLALSLGSARAQLSTSHDASFAPSATESSSNALNLDTDTLVSAALPAVPVASASGGGQYDNRAPNQVSIAIWLLKLAEDSMLPQRNRRHTSPGEQTGRWEPAIASTPSSA